MEAEKWTFNGNEARFEPPDIVWLSFHGTTDEGAARWTSSLFRKLAAKGPVFVASDVSDSNITAEARSYLAREAKPEWFRAVITIGAGVPQKAMSKAVNLALLFMGKPTIEQVFVDTAAEARQWIERARARH